MSPKRKSKVTRFRNARRFWREFDRLFGLGQHGPYINWNQAEIRFFGTMKGGRTRSLGIARVVEAPSEVKS